jgi:hypothetical protein
MSCHLLQLIVKYYYVLTGNFLYIYVLFINYLNTIFTFRTILSKTSLKTPHVELQEVGPSVDFVVRRDHMASADLFKTACKRSSIKVYYLHYLD